MSRDYPVDWTGAYLLGVGYISKPYIYQRNSCFCRATIWNL